MLFSNALVRFQMRKALKENLNIKLQDSYITDLYHPLKLKHQNTFISFEWIRSHSSQYQRLLEQIADYLIDKTRWWKETNTGVEFLDKETIISDKSLHHFRSRTLGEETAYIEKCWRECLLDKDHLIPAFKLKVEKTDRTVSTVVYLKTLKHFENEALTLEETITTTTTEEDQNVSTKDNVIIENLDITPIIHDFQNS